MSSFSFTTIEQYHSQLAGGSVTCVQAVEYFLAAIDQNKDLNAFIEIFSGEALRRASLLDGSARKGKLHGVVIGLKDNICYEGHHSYAASRILDHFTAPYSATAVSRLLDEGAIIIGRLNCDEFGMGSTNENSAFGPVLNPVNKEHVAGGSSGGSAAAVKAGLCMASLGSDTGGSVRLPADFCGVVGFKPTYGRISRHGLIAYASSFDQIGVLGSSVQDVKTILEVIAGPDNFDSTVVDQPMETSPDANRYRIAYFPEWVEHASIDPEISAGIKAQIANLKAAGHTVEPVSFSLTDFIVPTYYILTTAEASSNLARFDGVRYGYNSTHKPENLQEHYMANRSEGFGKEVKRRIMLGTFVLSSGYYDAYFTKAQQVRQLLFQQTEQLFRKYDLLIAPTSPSVAYRLNQQNKDPLAMYMGDIFTVFANLTGVPSVSLPIFKHSSNLPFGIQVLANHYNELPLLSFSHHLMQQ